MDSPDCVFRDSPECVFRNSPESVFSEEGYSCSLPCEVAFLAFGLLPVYEYDRRTLRARVSTAKAFFAMSPHVAGAADSGNDDRCVAFWPRSISFWRSPVERGRRGSYPHSRRYHATGSTGVYPSDTRETSARRIQDSERRKGRGTLAQSSKGQGNLGGGHPWETLHPPTATGR